MSKNESKVSKIIYYQRAIIPKFFAALGLSDKDKITINVVDKKTKRGMKREVEVSKVTEEKFLRFLRAQNSKGKEIFLLLPKNYLVLDDMPSPLKGCVNIETSEGSWHNILRFDRALSGEEARAIKLRFGADPSARCGTRLPGFYNKKAANKEEEAETEEEVKQEEEIKQEERVETQEQKQEDEEKKQQQGFLVRWDGSVAEELDLDAFLKRHNIKIKVERKQEKKRVATQGKEKKRFSSSRFRRFEPDWHSIYSDYLSRCGGDYSRADFCLAFRLLSRMDFWEAVDTLRSISLSFRPRERQQKSRTYWEHTVRKAEGEYRRWEASYSRRYREPDWSENEEENSPAWRAPGR